MVHSTAGSILPHAVEEESFSVLSLPLTRFLSSDTGLMKVREKKMQERVGWGACKSTKAKKKVSRYERRLASPERGGGSPSVGCGAMHVPPALLCEFLSAADIKDPPIISD